MDVSLEITNQEITDQVLSYDEIPYDDQIAPLPALRDRLGGKVYVPPTVKSTKRKHGADDQADEEADIEIPTGDDVYRTNALLITGHPISLLATKSIFSYVEHFDARPSALEWVNDQTLVLVYPSTARARAAQRTLRKSIAEEEDAEGHVTAKPVPVDLWPLEERVQNGLGLDKKSGMKGRIKMRKARFDDVKKKGAKESSEFYRKHGEHAGKDEADVALARKRRRREGSDEGGSKRARLDAELDAIRDGGDDPEVDAQRAVEDEMDAFLDDAPPDALPPRSLLERTGPRTDRPRAPLPRRGRRNQGRDEDHGRQKKTQEELDAELDAFLNQRD
ncbi:hypothetical protein SISNIDRAFT_449740 [Sistotremastrum niveocremeum HHB9708]|uniref:Chromatin target of PRMT1 protein C-terminal domain-containing protein n=1 Tax=Sistotremastrum niveocremeum HHB9708 TaxID=1314777 RepID=A0A164ZUW3_9AGAM|nr:hypothetical protein SISNIDRAFT_449740 [Sistotremastrum niveocremeum HHB9708]